MDDWSELETPPTPDEALANAVNQYQAFTAQRDIIDTKIEEAANEIFHHLDTDEPGAEVSKVVGNHVITVKVGEKYDWDKDALLQHYGVDDNLPDVFAKVGVSIDKKKFDAAAPSEKAQVLQFLTRKPGQKKISISENEG